MMRTLFTFNDDKELVQIVRSYEESGTRISWRDVAHVMRRTRHTATALQQRLRPLKRKNGNNLSEFPVNFFTTIDRPRGCPPAITRQLRALAAAQRFPSRIYRAALTRRPQTNPQSLGSRSPTAPIQSQSAAHASANMQTQSRTKIAPAILLATETTPSKALETPPLPPSLTEQAVTDIFADVSREVVLSYDGKSIHKNVGEVLPVGISMLLKEVGDLDDRDIFLDIDSGLGNVVAQVVLATNVYRIVGIESREQVQSSGIQVINRNPYAWAFRERAPFVCKDVKYIRLASTSPFAEATVVYWNNVLFEDKVTEHVKEQLQAMQEMRSLLSCINFCPRHRTPCFNPFCASFELQNVVKAPCSWKAELLSVYVYKSRNND